MKWSDYDQEDRTKPFKIYEYTSPSGISPQNSCPVIQHRRYISTPQAGTYQVSIGGKWGGGGAKLTTYLLAGSKHLPLIRVHSGPRTVNLANCTALTETQEPICTIFVPTGVKYVPFRIYFSNAGGFGQFEVSVQPPNGPFFLTRQLFRRLGCAILAVVVLGASGLPATNSLSCL